LNNVAKVLKAHPEVSKVTVEGHTDDQGDDAYNQDLSQRRAQAVVDFLVAAGVPADVFVAVGYGESRPVVPKKTKKARAANRRVEFKLEGISAAQPAP
jgi:outer membrane protein OmpA-like peptidoglycan-associated protein